ncbi:MAG: class II fructose-bisphosphate aldolase family protein [Rickettsiales bacterium]|nr:class II fructose-bisphosphate aldolase family protein [Rickettsiales bacterium]
MLLKALRGGRAVPAFNFYNLESLNAIARAAAAIKAPVIFAASESAIEYMGDDFLRFAASLHPLHLDHGRTMESVKHAVSLGFQSVMFDGSFLSFSENVRLTKKAAQYAHKHGVWIEAELGVLCGREDSLRGPIPPFSGGGGAKGAEEWLYTDPIQAKKFVELTGCDSLAIAIGTSHGAYKGNGKLRFDILKEIRRLLPKMPLVLHGASQIPQKYAKILKLKKAAGISAAEIRHAVRLGINKVNIDSDARLAWLAAMKSLFSPLVISEKTGIDPRLFLSAARDEMTELYKKEIKLIAGL